MKSDTIDPKVKRFCERKTKEMEVTPDLGIFLSMLLLLFAFAFMGFLSICVDSVTQAKKKMAKLMKGAHGVSLPTLIIPKNSDFSS